jgi:hypothetical protein
MNGYSIPVRGRKMLLFVTSLWVFLVWAGTCLPCLCNMPLSSWDDINCMALLSSFEIKF